MYKYVRTEDSLYIKRKVWDGVTGTIFNVPMLPRNDETKDRHTARMALIHHASFRDTAQKDIFPLIIRRKSLSDLYTRSQLQRRPETDSGKGLPLLTAPESPNLTASKEEAVNVSYNNPKRQYRVMTITDPWYVTPEQEYLRDVPPRIYPLPNHSKSDIIPYDDLHYVEHRMRDRIGEYGYFMTNLLSGEIVVNGQKIGLGEVAGPLPAFALIECPGGQVCFWWGENGREYGDGGQAALRQTSWDILRQKKGWEDVGRSAGEVWDERIIDRMKREESGGEGEEDDLEWEGYKNFVEKYDDDMDDDTRATVGMYTPFLDV